MSLDFSNLKIKKNKKNKKNKKTLSHPVNNQFGSKTYDHFDHPSCGS
jgi:hypothetical protein